MSLILKNLFLGSANDAYDFLFLKRNNIQLIVNVTKDIKIDYDGLGFDYIKVIRIPIDDIDTETLNQNNALDEALSTMKKYIDENKGVLVHCRAGVSRSASVVLAYLMKYYNIDFNQAFDYLRSKRPIISPNAGFITQLLNFKY
jgi:protein-tyrosine phosphatase